MKIKKINIIKLKDCNNTIITTKRSRKEFMELYKNKRSYISLNYDYIDEIVKC